jgi:hypothetical protein
MRLADEGKTLLNLPLEFNQDWRGRDHGMIIEGRASLHFRHKIIVYKASDFLGQKTALKHQTARAGGY